MDYHFIFYILPYYLVNKRQIGDIDDKARGTGRLKQGNYANLKLKQKQIDCPILFSSGVHDEPAPSFMVKPFKTIPPFFEKDYTYGGRVKVKPYYIEENFPTNRTSSKCIYTTLKLSTYQRVMMRHRNIPWAT